MVTPSRELLRAARGMAAIARREASASDRRALAYLAVYACGFAGKGGLERFRNIQSLLLLDTCLVSEIAQRVRSRKLVRGWRMTGRCDDRVLLEKDGVRAFAPVGELTGSEAARDAGAELQLEVPAILPGRLPGFVVRDGELGAAGGEVGGVSRLYLNLASPGAAYALGTLADTFEDEGLPFTIKVLGHPRAYVRRDACVLYFPSVRQDQAVGLVMRHHRQLKPFLGTGVPLLTRRIAPGVGFADEPSDLLPEGQSHGQWISGLLADGADGEAKPEAIAGAVLREIEACGRDPEAPYLRGERSASQVFAGAPAGEAAAPRLPMTAASASAPTPPPPPRTPSRG